MASFHYFLVLIISISFLSTFSLSQTTNSFRPKALVLPITKDTSTNQTQYVTQLHQRTPLVPLSLTLDLGGEFLWVDCETSYASTSYRPARCRSAACNLARSAACGQCSDGPKPGCNNNTCSLFPNNPFIRTSTIGEVATDVVSLRSTDGRLVSAPKFLFVCGSYPILPTLARGVLGIAGLGRRKIGVPAQLAAAFSFNRKFAICLGSSKGVVVFGNYEARDVSETLTYTPLIRNPVNLVSGFAGEDSAEYFIGVKSIKVNGKPVPVNASLLSFDSEGSGGTKISTVHPYTSLESSIYKAFVDAFVAAMAAKNVASVPAVEPFGLCFAAKDIGASRTGPIVPAIELVLGNGVTWRISGANSMVRVSPDVLCLGFVDGGPLHFVDWGVKFTVTAIVIGGHQIEDNLLQFDLASSRLGFSSSLLSSQTSCSNVNFTTIA